MTASETHLNRSTKKKEFTKRTLGGTSGPATLPEDNDSIVKTKTDQQIFLESRWLFR